LLKGLAMTSFVHTDFPTTHASIARVEAALEAARQFRARFSGARGLVALLLAGAFSALVVVADRLVNSWADGQIVMAWIGLWVLFSGAVLLFAEASQGWSEQAGRAIDEWVRARKRRLEDERTWGFALADPRFMRELQVARCRAETEAEQAGAPPPAWPFDTTH
jgi:hypothetical protein